MNFESNSARCYGVIKPLGHRAFIAAWHTVNAKKVPNADATLPR